MMDNSFRPERDRGVIMCATWSLWRSRNDRQHGKTPIDPGAAMEWALETCCQLSGGNHPEYRPDGSAKHELANA